MARAAKAAAPSRARAVAGTRERIPGPSRSHPSTIKPWPTPPIAALFRARRAGVPGPGSAVDVKLLAAVLPRRPGKAGAAEQALVRLAPAHIWGSLELATPWSG